MTGAGCQACPSTITDISYVTPNQHKALTRQSTELGYCEWWTYQYNVLYHAAQQRTLFCYITNKNENALRLKHCVRAGCSKAEPKLFAPPQTPFLGAQDGQNLISWRWSLGLPSPTNPVWWGSMHAISSYRGNRPTNTQTHTNPQTGPITIHCAASSLARNVIK